MTKQIDVDNWEAPENRDTGALPDDECPHCISKVGRVCTHWIREPMDEDEALEREHERVEWSPNDEANYQSNL